MSTGTALFMDGVMKVSFAMHPYVPDMELLTWDNRGVGVAGQWGLYHSVMLNGHCVFTWVDVSGRSENRDVTLGTYEFADHAA